MRSFGLIRINIFPCWISVVKQYVFTSCTQVTMTEPVLLSFAQVINHTLKRVLATLTFS